MPRRRGFLTGFLLGALLLLPLCASAQSVNFNYRAVHLIDGAPALDVHFNDRATASLSGVAFGTVSAVLPNLPSEGDEIFNVKYAPTGGGLAQAIVSADVTATSNHEYTGIGHGTAASPKLTVIARDRARLPAMGKALLRVVNLTSLPNALDVYLGSVGLTPAIANVATGKASAFVSVDAEATGLIFTATGQTVPIINMTAPLGSGTPLVTLIVVGSAADNLRVYVLNDFESGQSQLISLQESSYTNVRVLNLRPAPASARGDSLDIYMNRVTSTDTKVLDTLKYRWTSRDLGPVFTDSFRIKFVPVKESSNNSIHQLTRRFNNDTSYIVALTQHKDLRPTTIVLTRTPLEPVPPGIGSTLIRFVNATDFYGPITAVVTAGFDTLRFENLDFQGRSLFRTIAPGATPFTIEVYRAGATEPFYSGSSSTFAVPSGSYLTLFAVGNAEKFSVDILNESQSGTQPLGTFDQVTSAPETADRDVVALTLRPNPTSGPTAFTLDADLRGDATVRLVDVMGRVVLDHAFRVDAAPSTLSLDLTDLPAGVYLCRVAIDGVGVGEGKVVVGE